LTAANTSRAGIENRMEFYRLQIANTASRDSRHFHPLSGIHWNKLPFHGKVKDMLQDVQLFDHRTRRDL